MSDFLLVSTCFSLVSIPALNNECSLIKQEKSVNQVIMRETNLETHTRDACIYVNVFRPKMRVACFTVLL